MKQRTVVRFIICLVTLSFACSLLGLPGSNETLSTPEPPSFSVDNIQVDYVYTSELITVIYPLYGNQLDDFVIVTVTNQNEAPAKILVESEITGYTTKAINTVDVQAGETLEIRQNPRLVPEVIDNLNVEKLAQVHVRVAALQEGIEKPLLDETAETTIFARRDFPWAISGFTKDEVFELVAAMVVPNDPSVEALIRQAVCGLATAVTLTMTMAAFGTVCKLSGAPSKTMT